jgi:hypothetical protein
MQDRSQAGGYQVHQSCSRSCQYPVREQNRGNCQDKPANFRARCQQTLHFYILIQVRNRLVEGSINTLTGLPGKGHYAGNRAQLRSQGRKSYVVTDGLILRYPSPYGDA